MSAEMTNSDLEKLFIDAYDAVKRAEEAVSSIRQDISEKGLNVENFRELKEKEKELKEAKKKKRRLKKRAMDMGAKFDRKRKRIVRRVNGGDEDEEEEDVNGGDEDKEEEGEEDKQVEKRKRTVGDDDGGDEDEEEEDYDEEENGRSAESARSVVFIPPPGFGEDVHAIAEVAGGGERGYDGTVGEDDEGAAYNYLPTAAMRSKGKKPGRPPGSSALMFTNAANAALLQVFAKKLAIDVLHENHEAALPEEVQNEDEIRKAVYLTSSPNEFKMPVITFTLSEVASQRLGREFVDLIGTIDGRDKYYQEAVGLDDRQLNQKLFEKIKNMKKPNATQSISVLPMLYSLEKDRVQHIATLSALRLITRVFLKKGLPQITDFLERKLK